LSLRRLRAFAVSVLVAALALSNTVSTGRMAVSGEVMKINGIEGKCGREIAMVEPETGAVEPLEGDEQL
jgi:hypothetical protein